MRWDIFCKVIDNYGDIGTCWRLARQLAVEHQADVRLWVDDLESFSHLCPTLDTGVFRQRAGGIEVAHWCKDIPVTDVADVVIEAFACDLPTEYIDAMAKRASPPVWINLEYFSAEPWVEECHLLRSPHPTLPLTKYFFFPGVTSQTGGLLRERDLRADRVKFGDTAANEFWRRIGIPPKGRSPESSRQGFIVADEVRIALFSYENSALPELLRCWSDGPIQIRLLVSPGPANRQVADWLGQDLVEGGSKQSGALVVHALPFLAQPDYDRLLWACDVNFVRGEDSFVRAQWAEKPFVWQIYPQAENAHLIKLEAFLTRYLTGFPAADAVRHCWLAWNGGGQIAAAWQEFLANRSLIQQHGADWAGQLDQVEDLANNLARLVREK